jgi:hypothetical protein
MSLKGKAGDRPPWADTELDFPADCPVCDMMKASVCRDSFFNYHKCSVYHAEKLGKRPEEVEECRRLAIALYDCIQMNPHRFPRSYLEMKPPG